MTHAGELRVVLADRPGAGRTALAALVADTPGVALVGNVTRSEEIEAAVRSGQADVVVIDDRLLRHALLTPRQFAARLIVVGLDDHPGYQARADRIGAEAWIPKDRAAFLLPLKLTA
jgi:DNA-binding NarL/FixJ family response regulator